MNILWAKANKLLPLHSGGDIRSFHILKNLSSSNSVTFLSYYDGARDAIYEDELSKQLPSAAFVSTGKHFTGTLRAFDYFRKFSKSAPYAVSRFESHLVKEKLKALLEQKTYDVIVCDFLDSAINLPDKLNVPTVLFQHNVESEIWRRHSAAESNFVKRKLYRIEYLKMLKYEQAAVRKAQHVIAVSDHDRNLMRQWTAASRITVVPTGVDLQQYRPSSDANDSQPIVMFVGAMDWEPNIDAVEFFRREIWDSILARVPEARFYIVGRNPGRRVRQFSSNAIKITGRVDSAVDYLHKAAVVVVPLRIAGGTRLKIYEAMAAGKVVVSTTVGAEGLDIHNGRDIVIADDPGQFAASVVSLLQNSDLRRSYEKGAFATASQYDWPLIARRFNDVLESVVRS